MLGALHLGLCLTLGLPSLQDPAPPAGSPQEGPWQARLQTRGGALPFGLHLRREGEDRWRAEIVNGVERIPVPRVECADGVLTLGIDHYDSEIVARLSDDGGSLRGTWRKRLTRERWGTMDFVAAAGHGPRFGDSSPAPGARDLSGRWRVQFDGDEDPAVGLFEQGADGTVQGTFLTTLGDYRYLAGHADKDRMQLSCFDGAHAFLFRARRDAVGRLQGQFWSSGGRPQAWTAWRDPDAAMPEAFGLTRWEGGTLGEFAFPDSSGQERRLDDPAFGGKARLLVVFGTWCPNCHDETDYLVELDRKYRDRGLSILGLAFERTGDPERDQAQVRRYAEIHDVDYPILVAGLSDKSKASAAFPLIDRVRSYPTTVFLDEAGAVHGVHQGFSGPATGEAHATLRARFEEIIEGLLGSSGQ